MFIPDFDTQWVVQLYFALRICRLGKDIDAKFATRYFDAFTIAARLKPLAMTCDAMQQDINNNGLLGVFDYCLALGDWVSTNVINANEQFTINASTFSFKLTTKAIAAEAAVSAITAYSTIKTGDIIMPCTLPAEISVAAPTNITASITTSQSDQRQGIMSLKLR